MNIYLKICKRKNRINKKEKDKFSFNVSLYVQGLFDISVNTHRGDRGGQTNKKSYGGCLKYTPEELWENIFSDLSKKKFLVNQGCILEQIDVLVNYRQ